jgi:hypothetical protein
MIFSPPSFTVKDAFIPTTVYIVERLMRTTRKFQSVFYNVYNFTGDKLLYIRIGN